MKKTSILSVVIMFCAVCFCYGGTLDDILKGIKVPPGAKIPGSSQDDSTITSGLKEALSIGTSNAVTATSKLNGYFKNQMIKILLPENIQTMADVLAKLGYQRQVDNFILSMNRAAEKAAPKTKEYFIGAIKEMSFDDARKILGGGDTAATEFFKSKTSGKLFEEFKPIISKSMNDVGVTRSYKDMVGRYTSAVPFANMESLDLDRYVTNKALDGLFYMVGQEEKKIRTDPAARVTELLKKTFGR